MMSVAERVAAEGWEPCGLDEPCGNCGCPMRVHFGQNPSGYATRCNQCGCPSWFCRHGGVRTLRGYGRFDLGEETR